MVFNQETQDENNKDEWNISLCFKGVDLINHYSPSRKSNVVGKITNLPVRLLSWLASLV